MFPFFFKKFTLNNKSHINVPAIDHHYSYAGGGGLHTITGSMTCTIHGFPGESG